MAFGILGGTPQSQASILGGGDMAMAPPRIPWKNNQAVTMAALGMLGAPTINQGMQRAAAMVPAGMNANRANQQFQMQQQEKAAAKADQARQNAAVNAWLKSQSGFSLSPEETAAIEGNPELGRMMFGEALKTKFPQPEKATDDILEYNRAVAQGYTGSLMDFMTSMKQAGAQKSFPAPSPGMQYEWDEAGRVTREVEIPGGSAERARLAAESQSQVGAESQLAKAETMLDATRSIKEAIQGSGTPATGTFSRPYAVMSNTPAGRVRSYVSTLQSGVALQAILKLKEASSTGATGFGALSAPELQLLVDDIGSLDPDNTEPDIFLKTVDRIEKRWTQVVQDVKKTVPPERLAEMGIDIDALVSGSQPAAADPLGIR